MKDIIEIVGGGFLLALILAAFLARKTSLGEIIDEKTIFKYLYVGFLFIGSNAFVIKNFLL